MRTFDPLIRIGRRKRVGSFTIAAIACFLVGGLLSQPVPLYDFERVLMKSAIGRFPISLDNSVSLKPFLKKSRTSKSAFTSCKKLLALRQEVQVNLPWR